MKVSTNHLNCDTIKMLHKRNRTIDVKVELKEGERGRLCSNNVNGRSPSLSFNSNSPLVTEDMAIDYLAGLIVEAYLCEKYHGHIKKQESGDILPGFNKGTSRRR